MSQTPQRQFTDIIAKRERVPLLIGLVGASGSGKTGSALELAHGFQDVFGGDIGAIDTEAKRMLHYADIESFNDKSRRFSFNHLEFKAPFGPMDYLAAIQHFSKKGVKTIIVDSMSHEHEGPGGILEMHAAEVSRMAGDDYAKRDRVKMLAWVFPKQARRNLINAILQMPMNFIFCFRAKEKTKPVPGKDPLQLGWQPIAGEEFVYEMTLNCLLYPGSNGVPSWQPTEQAERQMIKLPQQFKSIFAKQEPLSIATGRKLAEWAMGNPGEKPKTQAPAVVNTANIPQENRIQEPVIVNQGDEQFDDLGAGVIFDKPPSDEQIVSEYDKVRQNLKTIMRKYEIDIGHGNGWRQMTALMDNPEATTENIKKMIVDVTNFLKGKNVVIEI